MRREAIFTRLASGSETDSDIRVGNRERLTDADLELEGRMGPSCCSESDGKVVCLTREGPWSREQQTEEHDSDPRATHCASDPPAFRWKAAPKTHGIWSSYVR